MGGRGASSASAGGLNITVTRATGKKNTVSMHSFIKQQTGIDLNKIKQEPVGRLYHSNSSGTFITSKKMSREQVRKFNEFTHNNIGKKLIEVREAGAHQYLVRPRKKGDTSYQSNVQKAR